MKKFFLVLMCVSLGRAKEAHAQTCSCFLAKEEAGRLSLEKISIENNRVEVINDPSVLAPVFSMGEGMNGDMVQKERRGGMIVAQCKDNRLKLKFRAKDGSEKPLPDMDLAELKLLNIRVNIVGGDGTRKAFLIEHYERVLEDKGPVIDMFGGKLPVKQGDYIITTETKKPATANSLTGKLTFRYANGWMIVPVSLDASTRLNFVVDMAATSSVIDRRFLPAGIPIRKMEMVEYTAGVEQQKEVATQGATGTTGKDVLAGKAAIPEILLDNLAVQDLNFSVLNTFPAGLAALGVAGILGTDLLMRAGLLTIRRDADGTGTLEFGDQASINGNIVPFTLAGGLFFADGKVADTPVSFLLDTGARESIINKSYAAKHALAFNMLDDTKTISGIDGNPVKVSVVRVPSFTLGSQVYRNSHMILGDIAALSSLGLATQSAILGMDFFRQFRIVQFDFSKKLLRLGV